MVQTKNRNQRVSDCVRKTQCRYCESPLPAPFLDLGATPLANAFLTADELQKEEPIYPLRLACCPRCFLVQLCDVVPPDRMFRNYLYVSSTTETFRRHFADYAKAVKARALHPSERMLAVDIGSNDGLLLSCYQAEGMQAVGVEPAANLSQIANRNGCPTVNDYFGPSSVETILKQYGEADIVSANNVFAHIDDIHGLCQNVNRLLKPDGLFVIEFPYLVVMMEKMLFDMIYHEHLSYIAVTPLRSLLDRFNLDILEIHETASHGGSLRVFIHKKGSGHQHSLNVEAFHRQESEKKYHSPSLYQDFAGRVQGVIQRLRGFVHEIKAREEKIAGYGAPAKGNTLLNSCALTAAQLDYIVDENPLKQGLYTPGTKIPVVPLEHLWKNPPDYILLLAWNFAEEIARKLEPLRKRGVKLIIPLPEPRIL